MDASRSHVKGEEDENHQDDEQYAEEEGQEEERSKSDSHPTEDEAVVTAVSSSLEQPSPSSAPEQFVARSLSSDPQQSEESKMDGLRNAGSEKKESSQKNSSADVVKEKSRAQTTKLEQTARIAMKACGGPACFNPKGTGSQLPGKTPATCPWASHQPNGHISGLRRTPVGLPPVTAGSLYPSPPADVVSPGRVSPSSSLRPLARRFHPSSGSRTDHDRNAVPTFDSSMALSRVAEEDEDHRSEDDDVEDDPCQEGSTLDAEPFHDGVIPVSAAAVAVISVEEDIETTGESGTNDMDDRASYMDDYDDDVEDDVPVATEVLVYGSEENTVTPEASAYLEYFQQKHSQAEEEFVNDLYPDDEIAAAAAQAAEAAAAMIRNENSYSAEAALIVVDARNISEEMSETYVEDEEAMVASITAAPQSDASSLWSSEYLQDEEAMAASITAAPLSEAPSTWSSDDVGEMDDRADDVSSLGDDFASHPQDYCHDCHDGIDNSDYRNETGSRRFAFRGSSSRSKRELSYHDNHHYNNHHHLRQSHFRDHHYDPPHQAYAIGSSRISDDDATTDSEDDRHLERHPQWTHGSSWINRHRVMEDEYDDDKKMESDRHEAERQVDSQNSFSASCLRTTSSSPRQDVPNNFSTSCRSANSSILRTTTNLTVSDSGRGQNLSASCRSATSSILRTTTSLTVSDSGRGYNLSASCRSATSSILRTTTSLTLSDSGRGRLTSEDVLGSRSVGRTTVTVATSRTSGSSRSGWASQRFRGCGSEGGSSRRRKREQRNQVHVRDITSGCPSLPPPSSSLPSPTAFDAVHQNTKRSDCKGGLLSLLFSCRYCMRDFVDQEALQKPTLSSKQPLTPSLKKGKL